MSSCSRVPPVQAGLQDWKRRKKESLTENSSDVEPLTALCYY